MMSTATGIRFRGFGEKSFTATPALFLTVVALLGGSCKQSEESATEGAARETAADTPQPELTAEERSLQTVLERYDALRARLAADEAELAEAPKALAEAARTAGEAAPEGWRANLDEVASNADALAAAGGIAARRELFGEISRELVTVLVEAPSVAARWNVFECPMASGYSKWIQKGSTMANPYMGKRMLECGTATGWKP